MEMIVTRKKSSTNFKLARRRFLTMMEHVPEDGSERKDESEMTREVQRTVDMMAVNLCLLETKPGKIIVSEVIENIRSDGFCLEQFKRRIKNFDDCKGICKDLVSRTLA